MWLAACGWAAEAVGVGQNGWVAYGWSVGSLCGWGFLGRTILMGEKG